GNFHEYHHNFQGYGVGNGGEVTNNGMSLVSYALFTKVSTARNIQNYGAGGLSGWNRYTSPTWALEQTLKIARDGEDPENGNQGLSLYATLLHNFGPDNYIQSKKQQQITKEYGEDYVGYMRAWQDITHNDMTYFFKDVLKGIDDNTAQQYKNSNYSTFVPVSSVYQTGRSYMYDGKKQYITTAQPYVIPADEPFTIDLNRYIAPNGQYESGSIVIPEEFTYKIKKVSKPQYGKIKNNKNGIYTYTPDSKHTRSGEIIVTLEIKRNDNQFKVDDVDLVLEFETTREHNKYVLQRTTYMFENGSSYTDAVTAFNENYKGYSNKVTADNVNKTQNSNTDIWYTNQEGDEMPKNAVVELEGKIYVDETAKYRIAIRGRYNVALFVAINDSNDYKLAAKYVQTNTDSPNFSNAEGTYNDMELKAGDWVKFKAVMITGNGSGKASFMGLGWGKFTPALGTVDEDGKVVGATEESVSVSYASAYRSSYEFPSNDTFKTDYFYKRDYLYDYKDNVKQSDKQTLVSTNYDKSISWNINEHKLENLFDGNKNTYIHTGNGITISQDTPLTITADLGSAKPVNRIT
ncbi:MAG: M60 family metallopeptidase, partial [Clostridia bacterium]|nr:M60 family metallopeptidase [Clostridia bacterium]